MIVKMYVLQDFLMILMRNLWSFTDPLISRHGRRYPIIADSGVNYHVFKDKEFFNSLFPASDQVILGDGKTALEIKGIGIVQCSIAGNIITINNVQ
jgi:hypothetical protein